MDIWRGSGLAPRREGAALRVECFKLVSIVSGGKRTSRGVLEELSLEEVRVQTGFRGRLGEIVVLTAVFDTSAVKLACRVVQQRSDGVDMRIVALTPEARAAVTRFLYTQLKADGRTARYLTPRFKRQPGQSRREHQPWAPEVRDTNRHKGVAERWL